MVFLFIFFVNYSWLWWSLNVADRFSACKESGWIWLHLLSSAVYPLTYCSWLLPANGWAHQGFWGLSRGCLWQITLALGLLVSLNEAFPELHCSLSSFNCQTFLSSQSGRPCDKGHCPWLLLAGELHRTPDLSRGCWWCLTAVDTFSCCSSLISNPCLSVVACETDPCLVWLSGPFAFWQWWAAYGKRLSTMCC